MKSHTEHITPYSLSIADASDHFGLSRSTLYQWVNDGKLIRGHHYLKIGRKPLIIRDKFIELMEAINNGYQE